MVAVILNEFNPLYIVDPIYYPAVESAHLTVPEGPAEGIAFAGMVDEEGQGEQNALMHNYNYEEQQHWDDLHRRRVDIHAHPVHEVRRLAWTDWYTQFNHTLYDHDMDNYPCPDPMSSTGVGGCSTGGCKARCGSSSRC